MFYILSDMKTPSTGELAFLVLFAVAKLGADAYGAELMREAPEHRLHAATRRSMMLAFARAAARRLQALADPQGPYREEG